MTNDSEEQKVARMKSDLEDIRRRVDSLPIVDSRSPDEIFGYDEHEQPN